MILTPVFIILFLLVFILLWQFVKSIDNRKWISLLLNIVFTPIVYFFLFYPLLNIFSSYHHEKYFDSEAWKKEPKLRFEMSNQIIENQLFKGKTKTEILKSLGKSEWYGWNDSIKANSQDKWNYNLGFKPGAFNSKQECLELIFKNDTVIKSVQYQIEKTDY
ncbi:hypothetical protein SAMN05216503_0279 [Polaribacter sp. KT25b]|uniref:hypothetical protein n=1 Tax=Polaribacter sp. KT25b TaxID=1855336 RepID=UPI00087AE4BA|nr:hypothetical protein [Polaribacter sp. KT25b]SDR67409.1 hypothetical protein SAMN05216503_0279 [Polaribacter sp. KT25b]